MQETQQTHQPQHIAIIPTPGVGHLIPLSELAKRLTHHFNFTITILIPNDGTPPSDSQLSLLQNLPNTISHHFLSPVDVSDLGPNPPIEGRITLTTTRSVPEIRDWIRALHGRARPVALVVDLFGYELFDVAHEFGILSYMFFITSGLALGSAFTLPKLDKIHTCEYRDLPEPVQLIPGSVPVRGTDFPDPVQNKKNEVYKMFLEMTGSYSKPAGILVNSFLELEPVSFEFLTSSGPRDEYNIPLVYHIGPVIRTDFGGELDGSKCLEWLDEQPSDSVLFVSFGSGGNLSHEQLIELALGLESSCQRFLWVVKTPHDIANASFFGTNNNDNPLEYLPEGFLERTKGFGLVVPSWAPQIQILSHSSVGGFLTHCGWNSILESIVHGVPLIAWPLFAEQKLNAVLVTEELKVGLRVKPNEKGLIERDHIAHYAQCLIQGLQGRELRDKMGEMKHAANVALNEGGSSQESLKKVAQVMMNHKIVANGDD